MALKIVAVRLARGAPSIGWKHHHIDGVKCTAALGGTGPIKFRTEVALDISNNRETYYIVDNHGVKLDIEVFDYNSVKCVRTRPEGSKPDPLLSLPTFEG
jgi:hypothetical protein